MFRTTITPISDKEIGWFRIFFMILWIAIIGGIPWILWNQKHFLILIPIMFTIFSVPFGWYVGYKKLIGPMGFVAH
jgi:hypothetical protein